MASRRKRPKELNLEDQIEILEAATRLHQACRRPMISVSSDQYRALVDLNQAICDAIRKIYGKDPPWASLPGVWDDFNAEARMVKVDQERRFGAK